MLVKGNIIYDGPLKDIKYRFGDLRTLTIKTKEQYKLEDLNTFDNKVEYSINEDSIVLQFNADKLDIKEVIDYCFHELGALDLKISEISIEDVVKNLLAEAEKC